MCHNSDVRFCTQSTAAVPHYGSGSVSLLDSSLEINVCHYLFLDKWAKIWQSKFASGSACQGEFPGKFPVAGERLPCCHAKRPANLRWARNGESTRSSTVPVWKRKYLWNQWVPCCLREPMCIS